MKLLVKIIAFAFLFLFGLAIYWQNNDPDALQWYARYGVGFAASLLFLFDRLPRGLAFTLALAFFVLAFLGWPEAWEGVDWAQTGMKSKNIEEGREAAGMIISGLVFLLYGAATKVKKDKK